MLNVVQLSDAVETLKKLLENHITSEMVSLEDCHNRVLASDVYSDYDIPQFDRSTVDGYAVCSSDTYGSSETMPAILKINGKISMGEIAGCEVKKGCCCEIATGAMLPSGADSVVMIEYTEEDFGDCLVMKAATPFENITKKGDDIKKGQKVLSKGSAISAVEAGVLASIGKIEVEVYKKLKVAVVSTGDEIVSPGEELKIGKVYDSNSYLVSSLLKKIGCETKFCGIISDDFEKMKIAMQNLLSDEDIDIIVLSGGSSAGTKDMTAKIINTYGEVLVHGIAMKPGKPTIIGQAKGKVIIGLPGHPAAAFFVTETVLRTAVESCCNRIEKRKITECLIGSNISSNHGREEIIPVKITGNEALPVFAKSGILSNIANSDGYITIERDLEGLKKGDTVKVILY